MKIIKYILLPIVLLFSLFTSTSAYAANNLSTSFTTNNDELTVNVKNNSDKEISDIEYNLNLPKEYNAEYITPPKYVLSPSEDTTFKVKVSELGQQSSTDNKKVNTYTSNKDSLANTGVVSEVAVGTVVLLLLLAGVLLYYKQRKLLVIILIAGLGAQLFPRYSLAADKVRTTERFSDTVELLSKSLPISLDITYLIDGDSTNGNSSGNGNGNNNSGDGNGVNPKPNDPKEVLVAGYAYSGKTNSTLESKELKVFDDSGKELATVNTDSDGYFFTHLVQGKTYTIKGEDFEITVTAKNSGDYDHNDIVGKLVLGRLLQDANTDIKVKPSVAFISEDTEYKVEDNKVTIDGEYKLKVGDKLVLAPNHDYLTGFAVTVDKVSIEDGKTVLTVTPITTLDDIVDDFKYSEEVDISSMKFIPAEGVKVVNKEQPEITLRSSGELSSDKLSLEIEDEEVGTTASVELEGKLGYDIDIFEPKAVIIPEFNFSLSGETKVLDKSKEKVKKLGTLLKTTTFGISTDVDLYFYWDASGKLSIKYKYSYNSKVEIGYKDGKTVFNPEQEGEFNLGLNFEGSAETGLKLVIPIKVFFTIDVAEISGTLGPGVEGKATAELTYNKKDNLKGKISGEVEGYLRITGKAEIGFPKEVFPDLKVSITEESKIKIFSYPSDDDKPTPDPTPTPNKPKPPIETSKNEVIYKSILDKYKTAMSDRSKATLDNSINTIATANYFNWGESQVGHNYLNYGFFDIDGNGVDELLLFTESDKNKHNLTSPMDIYTHDKNNNIIRLTPSGVNGERTTMSITDDGKNFIVRGSAGAWNHGYDFYNFINGNKIEKTDSFSFDGHVEPNGEYSRTYPKNQEEKLGKVDFEDKYLNKKLANFDFSKRKSILDYNRQRINSDYTNAQLALIGRYLSEEGIPDYLPYENPFTIGKNGDDLFTSYGTGASIIKTNVTEEGIEISRLDYDKPVGERDFKVFKKVTWAEIKEQISEEQLKKINRLIEEYKKSKNYQITHIDD